MVRVVLNFMESLIQFIHQWLSHGRCIIASPSFPSIIITQELYVGTYTYLSESSLQILLLARFFFVILSYFWNSFLVSDTYTSPSVFFAFFAIVFFSLSLSVQRLEEWLQISLERLSQKCVSYILSSSVASMAC